jgi:hypothetical protein
MGEAGVDLRQDRLKDALRSVEAALKIPFGLLFHRGDYFFRLHMQSPLLPIMGYFFQIKA